MINNHNFSSFSRHSGKNDSIGPGPGQYNITGLSAKGESKMNSSTDAFWPQFFFELFKIGVKVKFFNFLRNKKQIIYKSF